MTDRTNDLPPGKVLMPEVIDEPFESALTPETVALINETIDFINHTVSAKALETALLIGDYILTNYFDDDLESAFSKNPDKPISFNIMCEHPEIRLSRNKLINMVKVAAQERFLRTIDLDYSSLSYTHLEKLIQLPNDSAKIDMARECIAENLTTRQLGYRVRIQTMESGPTENETPEPDPPEQTIIELFSTLDHLTGQVASLNLNTLLEFIEYLSAETKESLQNKLMTLIDTMDAAETECEGFLQQLQPRTGNNNY